MVIKRGCSDQQQGLPRIAGPGRPLTRISHRRLASVELVEALPGYETEQIGYSTSEDQDSATW